ncbi:response regulator transcription factor [Dyadobacter sandarakinus]|uniref:Response regulator transcription factor n=1 Tax=Dyadobacter sandarakinus TaxID=2747268 RepID=A0ABX7ICY6_9BACT|nr:response regulator transcription factor [Dyadobacter sandarakinus]QRR02781.1 response regulator transcription factor [Dyadobacter sandarakinus]
MPNLLLVEDDSNLGFLLQEYLTDKGFPTDLATDGQKGWQSFVDKEYDLCIFDVMMPKKDGFSLAKEVRMSGRDVPIIFLTAKSMKEDTMQGFRVGADDYVTKPFDREELLLRIEAILRRYKKQPDAQDDTGIYHIGAFTFDYSRQQLTHDDKSARLTSKESELLKLFCQNINQPISRSFALKTIWGDDSYFNARSMDVYITKLRKYLREDPSIQIMNLHGEGFKLMVG